MQVTATKSSISTEAAHRAVAAAVEKATDLEVRINAAVVDQSGLLMAFLRMHGAFLHSIDIAIDKAYTAASFGLPTSKWDELLPIDSLLRDGIQHRPRMVAFGGGLPIIEKNEVIGGLGVSGGSEEQDELCSKAGIDMIHSLLTD